MVKKVETFVGKQTSEYLGRQVSYSLTGTFNSEFCKDKGYIRYQGKVLGHTPNPHEGKIDADAPFFDSGGFEVNESVLKEVQNLIKDTKYESDRVPFVTQFFIKGPVNSLEELAVEQKAIADYLGEDALIQSQYTIATPEQKSHLTTKKKKMAQPIM